MHEDIDGQPDAILCRFARPEIELGMAFDRFGKGCEHFNAPTGLRWQLESDGNWILEKDGTALFIAAIGRFGKRKKYWACYVGVPWLSDELYHRKFSDARDAARALVARVLADESRGGK